MAIGRRKTPDYELPHEPIYVNPTANLIFTSIMFLEVFLVFAGLLRGTGNVVPIVEGTQAATMLAACCVGCFFMITVVKRGSGALGALLSRHVLPDDPLSKPRTRHKFEDQMWQLAIHVSMSCLEAYVLFYEDDGGVPWWDSYVELWKPLPWSPQPNKQSGARRHAARKKKPRPPLTVPR